MLVCLALYVLSLSNGLTVKFTNLKNRKASIVNSDTEMSDLYRFSYLSKFRESPTSTPKVVATKCDNNAQIDLYQVGDSYIWKYLNNRAYYCNVNKSTMVKTNNKGKLYLNLDSSKVNVLLVEFAERNIIRILQDTGYTYHILNKANNPAVSGIVKGETRESISVKANSKWAKFKSKFETVSNDVSDVLFNSHINTNIELNLWNMALFSPIKEFKANVNYYLFGSVDKDVRISSNQKQLYLASTIDTLSNESSFQRISDAKLDTLINSFNVIYQQAKAIGFNKIYLSIIPSPVSVLEPRYQGMQYNYLVDRLQKSQKLQFQCIDIMPEFRQLQEKAYFKADSHWNNYGAQLWLNKFNNVLQQSIKEQDNSSN